MNLLMTVETAAIALSVHPNTIRNWINSGRLPAKEVRGPGGQIRRPYQHAVLMMAASDPTDTLMGNAAADALELLAERLEMRVKRLRRAADLLREDPPTIPGTVALQ